MLGVVTVVHVARRAQVDAVVHSVAPTDAPDDLGIVTLMFALLTVTFSAHKPRVFDAHRPVVDHSHVVSVAMTDPTHTNKQGDTIKAISIRKS